MLTLIIKPSSSICPVMMPGNRVRSSATFWVGNTPHSSKEVTFLMFAALRCCVSESAWPSFTDSTVNACIVIVSDDFIATSTAEAEPFETLTFCRDSSNPA